MAKAISYPKLVLLATAWLSVCSMYAQNLVPNPGFEVNTACPQGTGKITLATPWTSPLNSLEAEYFHTCSNNTATVPVNQFGYQWPATGNGFAGIFLYATTFYGTNVFDGRQYIMSPLTSPLQSGVKYVVSLKVSLSNTAYIPTDELSVYFSSTPLVYTPPTTGWYSNIPVTPQFTFPDIISDTAGWTTLSYLYTATGSEQYMTIGNFKDNANSSIYPPPGAQPYFVSFVLLDDISVTMAPIQVIGTQATCAGEPVTLVASNSNTYAWATSTAPDVILSTSPTFTVSPTVPTTYFVYGNNHMDTASVTVTIKPTPTVNLGNDTTICQGDNLLLIAYQGGAHIAGTQYLWHNGNTTPFFTPTQSGTYWVTATLNGCSASDTVNVVLNPNPSVNLGPDAILCEGQTLTLNAALPNATYLWQDNSTGSAYTVQQGGTYKVTVSQNGCTATDSITVTEQPMPVVNLGNDATLCSGSPLTLNATTAGASYLWQNNATTPTLSPTASGLYWVQVTLNGCSDRDSVQITFLPLPTVQLGNDTMPCVGSTILLDATGPGLSYRWQDDSGQPTYTVAQSGTYSVQVTDANGCQNSDAVTVTFINAPQLSFVDSTLCKGDEWLLDVTTPAATYLWQDKSVQPTYTIYGEGTYWATVTNACGSVSDTAVVDVRRCDCFLYIPDSFTPNLDFRNEKFLLTHNTECTLEQYTFSVFNRWGQLIFETGNIEFLWDGTHNGKILPMDVYVYRVEYKFDKSPLSRQWGHISLVR